MKVNLQRLASNCLMGLFFSVSLVTQLNVATKMQFRAKLLISGVS